LHFRAQGLLKVLSDNFGSSRYGIFTAKVAKNNKKNMENFAIIGGFAVPFLKISTKIADFKQALFQSLTNAHFPIKHRLQYSNDK